MMSLMRRKRILPMALVFSLAVGNTGTAAFASSLNPEIGEQAVMSVPDEVSLDGVLLMEDLSGDEASEAVLGDGMSDESGESFENVESDEASEEELTEASEEELTEASEEELAEASEEELAEASEEELAEASEEELTEASEEELTEASEEELAEDSESSEETEFLNEMGFFVESEEFEDDGLSEEGEDAPEHGLSVSEADDDHDDNNGLEYSDNDEDNDDSEENSVEIADNEEGEESVDGGEAADPDEAVAEDEAPAAVDEELDNEEFDSKELDNEEFDIKDLDEEEIEAPAAVDEESKSEEAGEEDGEAGDDIINSNTGEEDFTIDDENDAAESGIFADADNEEAAELSGEGTEEFIGIDEGIEELGTEEKETEIIGSEELGAGETEEIGLEGSEEIESEGLGTEEAVTEEEAGKAVLAGEAAVEINDGQQDEQAGLMADGELSLEGDASYSPSQLSVYKKINLNGHALTVSGDFVTDAEITLGINGSLTVNGDMTASKDVHCEKGTLNVKGNYTQTNGRLEAYQLGTINITGNAAFTGNGHVYFFADSSKVTVGGNVNYSSLKGINNNKASWTVSGNVTQEKDTGLYKAGSLVLNGSGKQSLDLQENSEVCGLEAVNSQIAVSGYLNNTTLNSDFKPEMSGDLFTEGLTLDGHRLELPNGLIATGKISIGDNGTLLVNGDMSASEDVDCEKGTLSVKGNYTQTNGELKAYQLGTINITGNAAFTGNGYVYFFADSSKVTVGGNVSYSSLKGINNNKASWTVGGNVTQEKDTGLYKAGSLVLNGSGKQSVSLQENSEVGGLEAVNSQIAVSGYLNNATLNSDFKPEMSGDLLTKGLSLNGHRMELPQGLISTGKVSIGDNGTLIVNGDMNASEDVDCKKGTLSVKGNYTQTKGSLEAYQLGTINIVGNAAFTGIGNIYFSSDSSKVTIGGNVSYSSSEGVNDNKASWTVGGNVTQENDAGLLHFNELRLTTAKSSLSLPNGHINTLVLDKGKSKFTLEPEGCWDSLVASSTVKFDAAGGTTDTASKTVTTKKKYGTLPKAQRDGYNFEGWYTKSGTKGTVVKAATIVEAVDDHKLYAHWTLDISKAKVSLPGSLVYDGKEKEPVPEITLNGASLKKGTDYTISYSNNINAGKASAVIKGKGNYAGEKTVTFKIAKAAQKLKITKPAGNSLVPAGTKVTIKSSGAQGKLTYKSGSKAIAVVSAKGVVTGKKVGTVKITVKAAATDNYKAASKTLTLKVTPAKTSSFTVTNTAKGVKLSWKKVTGATGYYVYRNGKKVATIKKAATVTYTDTKAKKNGTKYQYQVYAYAKTGRGAASAKKTIYFLTRPAFKGVNNRSQKTITVELPANAKATGYEVRYVTGSTEKTKSFAKKGTSVEISGLQNGKTYQVSIRSYKKVGNTNYYSDWSAVKKITIKK